MSGLSEVFTRIGKALAQGRDPTGVKALVSELLIRPCKVVAAGKPDEPFFLGFQIREA
jgi:hypothetical protein